jgi:2-hydroxy-6-oxonona-2,4-dienedioate hydrolase
VKPLADDLPEAIHDLHDVRLLASAAQLAWTPCGDGRMVWRGWGVGEPVVLLHGGAGSWTHWVRNVAPLVRAGRRVWVPDLPGFGESAAPPEGHDADALPPLLENGLEIVLGGAPFDLVGFSFGGLVGGLLAARLKSSVRRFIVVGAPALSATRIQPIPLLAWHVEPSGPARDAVLKENLLRLMLSRESSVDDVSLALHEENLERDRMRKRRLQESDLLLRTMPSIVCPVSGIWGIEDALYRGRTRVIEEALATAPGFNSLTFVSNAGHWVQYEEPEAFNGTLLDALEDPVTR